MEKMTYVVALDAAINCEALDAEVREKLSALLAQQVRKNATKKRAAKDKPENVALRETIVNSMVAGENYTVTEIMKLHEDLAVLSNQKVTHLLGNLRDDLVVGKTDFKGTSRYFLL